MYLYHKTTFIVLTEQSTFKVYNYRFRTLDNREKPMYCCYYSYNIRKLTENNHNKLYGITY